MPSLYRNDSGKREILKLYDRKLNELEIDSRSQYVDTRYGKTHILITGAPSNPPLLLIHGSNACAPIALECYPNLSSKYQVFAVDVLAQPNKSDENRLSMSDDSYGIWMNEVIDQLKIDNVILTGFSFGGLIILKTLAYNADKIKEVFLASPAYIVNGNPLKALFQIFIPMKLFIRTNKPKYVEKFLYALFTERDPFAIQFISKALKYFIMDYTPVPIMSEDEATQINTPITLIAAAKDILFPGVKMIARAQKLFPNSIKYTLLLEQSKHVQSKEGNSIVENLILDA